MNVKDQTFSQIYHSFRLQQETKAQDTFTAACCAFLSFETTRLQTTRLSILYILYTYYSSLPLDHNPFLTFFLQLIDDLPSDSIEQHFVHCILEETLSNLDNILPEEVCNARIKLPAIQRNENTINILKIKVNRLIDDPDIVVFDERIANLISNACHRSLTLSENELLRNEFNLSKNYPLTDLIPPAELPNLINLNQFLALDIASELFNSRYAYLYLQSILESPITTNSIEVIHHVLVHENDYNNTNLSQEFLHYYISHSIRSCDQAPNGLKKDRQVKQVTRFIHSLLEKNIIPLSEYMIEIQAFCVTYMKVGGVANLFQSISAHNHYNRQMMLMNQFNSNVSSTASSSSTPLYF